MARREELTDEQWALLEPLFDKPPTVQTRGRPRRADREVLNGVLWILRCGARWCDMPERFPPYQTCHRRFQQWVRERRLKRVLETLAEDLRVRGGLDLSECFIDGMFVVAKKGAQKWERPSWSSSRHPHGENASPHEVRLVRKTLVERFTDEAPERLIGDKACDSDPLRLFAWLQNFRRILVRYEYHDDNYLGFVHLGCILILLRAYF